MLSFLIPAALFLALGIIPLALFYFLRLRYRRQSTSSTFLWQKLLKDEGSGRSLRWKSLLLFLIQVALVIAISLGAAGLFFSQDKVIPPSKIYLLDHSASMSAPVNNQSASPSRYDIALETLMTELSQEQPDTPIYLFLLSNDAKELAGGPWTATDAEKLQRILKALVPEDSSFQEDQCARTLKAWLEQHPIQFKSLIITDGGASLAGQELTQVFKDRIESRIVGEELADLAVHTLRQEGLNQFSASIFNSSAEAKTLELELLLNNDIISTSNVLASPGTTRHVLSPDESLVGYGMYQVRIKNGIDPWTRNNQSYLALNPAPEIRILHAGPPNPFIDALFSAKTFTLEHQASLSETTPYQKYDLLIADGIPIIGNPPVHLISFNTLESTDAVQAGKVLSGLLKTSTNQSSLNRHINWQDIIVQDSLSLKAGPRTDILATVEGQPMIVAWQEQQWQRLAFGTDCFASSIGLDTSFPILIRNFLEKSKPGFANPLADTLDAGQSQIRPFDPSWQIETDSPVSITKLSPSTISLFGKQQGAWRWQNSSNQGWVAFNLPKSELDLKVSPLQAIPSQISANDSHIAVNRERQRLDLGLFILILAIALLITEWLLWFGKLPSSHGQRSKRSLRPLLIFRLLSLGFLVLAISGLGLPWPSNQMDRVIVLDTSPSMGHLTSANRQLCEEIILAQKSNDRIAIISFDQKARLICPLVSNNQALQALAQANLSPMGDIAASNLAAALDLAHSILKPSHNSTSIILISDGHPTIGGSIDDLISKGLPYPIHSMISAKKQTNPIQSGPLLAPSKLIKGQNLLIEWELLSDYAQTVRIDLSVNTLIKQSFNTPLKSGTNPIAIDLGLDSPGLNQIQLDVFDADGLALPYLSRGIMVENNTQQSVLLISSDGQSSPLLLALRQSGIQVTKATAEGLPHTQLGMAGYQAIILDNMPSSAMDKQQLMALQSYIRAGGGLLITGGNQSLGRGAYYNTVLEELSPVESDTRPRAIYGKSKILFVVDHSGSMTDLAGSRSKLEIAMDGVSLAMKALKPIDEVGILAFDSTATWVLPFTQNRNNSAFDQAISSIDKGGGTDIGSALAEVVKAFENAGPGNHHVLLLSDGNSAESEFDFNDLALQLSAQGVVFNTIGIGNDANDEVLKNLAQWGKGTFHKAQAEEIPVLLTAEANRITRDLIQEGSFIPRLVKQGNFLRSMATNLPAIKGYLITKPKAFAKVWLDLPSENGHDPLLATWQYGNGNVAVLTSDSGQRWLAPWVHSAVYNNFIASILAEISTPPAQALNLKVEIEAGIAHLAVEALDSQRQLESGLELVGDCGQGQFSFNETAPGYYQSSIALNENGMIGFSVYSKDRNHKGLSWLWNPPGIEFAQNNPNLRGLGELSLASGGLLIPSDINLLPAASFQFAITKVDLLFWILALVCFLLELASRSTLVGQGKQALIDLKKWWYSKVNSLNSARQSIDFVSISNPLAGEGSDDKSRKAWRILAEQYAQRNKNKQNP